MITYVGFVISEEDLVSAPGTRLDHSELLCSRSFITVKKARESLLMSDIDIRRRMESTPLTHLIKALYTFTRLTPTTHILN